MLSSFNITVIEEGVNGMCVPEMSERLPSLMQSHKPSVVIILGGTNDLNQRKASAEIGGSIHSLHKIAHTSISSEKKVITVALTVLQASWNDSVMEMNRQVVNGGIKNLAKHHPQNVVLCDIAAHPNFRQWSKESEYWSVDGVHLSIKGYDSMADIIFDCINKFNIP